MNRILKTIFAVTFLIIGFFAFDSFAMAADRYWVGGTADWDATAGTKWATTSGGAGGAAVPGASDDVYFDVNSGANTVTITTAATINSWTVKSDVNGLTITHNAGITVTVGQNASATGPSNKILDWHTSNWTYTLGNAATSVISFGRANTVTPQEVNFGGKTVGNVNFATVNTGSWKFTSGVTQGTTATLNLGSAVSTIDLNAQTFTVGNWTCGSSVTLTATGSTITMTGSSATFAGGGKTYADVNITGGGTKAVTSANSYTNWSITGTAATTDTVTLAANQTITGSFVVAGNSITNRVLIRSNTTGTQRTITSASNTLSNLDLQDIAGAGAASWNLSAITGGSGDCGGNSVSITFTTAQSNYWVGNAGNWSTAAEWASTSGGVGGTGRVPLPQDDAIFDRNSFTSNSHSVSQNMPRMAKNIDFSDLPNGSFPNQTWTINNLSQALFGSLTIASTVTLPGSPAAVTFAGRGSFTLTTAGKSLGAVGIDAPGGTLTLQDAFTYITTLTLTNGTLNTNGYAVSGASFTSSAGTTLTLGASTFTLTGTGGFNINATTTINPDTSTIVMSNSSATTKTFAGAGKTYYNATFSGDNVTITGSNAFNNIAVNTAGLTNGLKLTISTTQTISGTLTTNGSAGNLAKLLASATGTAALSKTSGQVCVDYMAITDVTAGGGASWYAGANSTLSGTTTGWTGSACPVGGSTDQTMIIIID